MTIVGVVGDVKPEGLDRATEPETYSPYEQTTDDFLAENLTGEMRSLTVVVRTSMDPLSEAETLSRRIHAIDPSMPISNVKTMGAALTESTVAQRFHTGLVAAFAGIALLLAALGVGGVLAFTVAQRIPEIGVRLALGAKRSDVLRLVFTRGMRLALYGIGIGLVCSLWVVRLIGSVLYETSPNDAASVLIAPATLCAVALLAIAIPARRAASVDPLLALRAESRRAREGFRGIVELWCSHPN